MARSWMLTRSTRLANCSLSHLIYMVCCFIFSNFWFMCHVLKPMSPVPGCSCWVAIRRSKRFGDVPTGTNRWGNVQTHVSVSARVFIAKHGASGTNKSGDTVLDSNLKISFLWSRILMKSSIHILAIGSAALEKFNQCGYQWFRPWLRCVNIINVCVV